MIWISSFRNIFREVLIVLITELFLYFLVLGEVLLALTTSAETYHKALERDNSGSQHDIRVQNRQGHLNIVKRHIYLENLFLYLFFSFRL